MLLLAIKSSLSAGPQTALRVSHIIEKFLSKVPVYICSPPPKNQEKAPKPVSKTGNGIGFFFFANDGSSVCVKESERQRERGSTLISSIMTHGGGGICLRIPHQSRRRVSGGLCIYFPRSSRAAGASAEADDWKETLL